MPTKARRSPAEWCSSARTQRRVRRMDSCTLVPSQLFVTLGRSFHLACCMNTLIYESRGTGRTSSVTANLKVDLLVPLHLHTTYYFEGAVTGNTSGRKFITTCRLLTPDQRVVHAMSKSLMVLPRGVPLTVSDAQPDGRNSKL